MKKDELETKLSGMELPATEQIRHQQELKIPLLSYKKSSRLGMWLILLPMIIAIVMILKHELGISSPLLDVVKQSINTVDRNPFLTYLIPLLVVGIPLSVITMNLLAICHFVHVKEKKEFVVTLKLRFLNIALVIFSFVVLVYFFLPDSLSF